MASLRQSLQERARLSNVGGDMRLGKHYRNMQDEVQRNLAKATDKAKRRAEKGDKEDDWINAIKLISGFTPLGAPINAALSAYDLIGDVYRGVNIPKLKGGGKYAGTPYEQFYKQNIQALNEQVKGARKGKLGKSLVSNLLNIGMQPLFSAKPGVGEDLTKGFGFKDAKFTPFKGEESIFGMVKGNFSDTTLKTLEESIPGLGIASGLSGNPTLRNLFLSGTPLASSLIRGNKTPTSPMAPGYQRPSIRRRIR